MAEICKCKSCETTDESHMYITVQGVGCYCKDCYDKSLNDSLYRQIKKCCICQKTQDKDNMVSCEFEGKDSYVCETCLLNDKAKVSRGNTDPKIEGKDNISYECHFCKMQFIGGTGIKTEHGYICGNCFGKSKVLTPRQIGDTVYDSRDADRGEVHEGVIIAMHPDGIHHIVEYADLGVYKEDLSQQGFSKEKYNGYDWIDNAIEESGIEDYIGAYTGKDPIKIRASRSPRTVLDDFKKALINNLPK